MTKPVDNFWHMTMIDDTVCDNEHVIGYCAYDY
jgi:hypothetical protein